MINPTTGRVVWYTPGDDESRENIDKALPRAERQPMAATVVYVHNPRLVNLAMHDHMGFLHTLWEVPLVQDDDPVPETGYAAWMPYQIGQAKAAESAPAPAPVEGGNTAS